jgi:hypothetical protein
MFLTRGQEVGTGAAPIATPSPSASPSASPSPSPALTDTSNWVPFTSERYGFALAHPPTWTATPATRDWDFETDRMSPVTPGSDHFIDEDAAYKIGVVAFATDVQADMSEDEWLAAYYEGLSASCGATQGVQPISVDGHEGRLIVHDACSDAQAFVFIDDRVHVFAVWRADQEALLEAFLSTVEFQQ